ncbi:MAG: ferrous iron transport protein B [Bacteroidetes bacterium]|nr:ferrous iron transport protein B [Bacteroidota bacterium]
MNANSQKIDKVLLNKYLGLPIFIVFILLMFFTTFFVGSYPIEWISSFFEFLQNIIDNVLNDGILKELINDGILPGVGLVISFLPSIFILFFFISFMEDSGYLVRIGVILDNFMKLFGLSGQSVVLLLMGFGCNVPAILAANSIKNRSEKIRTILLIPFMSCSGRLPVYILITGMLFSKLEGVFVLISIYLLGILLAIFFSLLFKDRKHTSNQKKAINIKLPDYKLPSLKQLLNKISTEIHDYIKKIYSVLLVASIIIWFLQAFPQNSNDNNHNTNKKEQIEHSYLGIIGKKIEPILLPLGFDWRISIALITGITAKETAISTLGVLFNDNIYDADINKKTFTNQLKNAKYISGDKKGEIIFTIPVGLTFMVFFLIYFPCISVFVAIKKVAGKKHASLIGMFTILAAYFVAFVIKVISDFIFL